MLRILTVIFYIFCICLPKVHAATTTELAIEEDTYVEEKFPTAAPWNNRNLYLGTDTWYAKGKNRILIKPNFSTLQDLDVLVTDIEKVELLMTSYEYEGLENSAVIDSYTTTSPWSMFTASWNLQPSITTKKDTSVITTVSGQKTLLVTNAFIEAYKAFPLADKGVLLKINAETDKALIFWAHGCDIAPTPPICSGIQDRPRFRITVKTNHLPTICTLKTPTSNSITNNPSVTLEPNPSIDIDGNTVSYIGRACTEITCESPIWQATISPGLKTVADLPDGTFIASCVAIDGHDERQWGDPISIVIDTKPPSTPILIEEPPFTGNLANQVQWFPNELETVEYQVLSSERSNFSSYNTYSSWIREHQITIAHTKEKAFYYKVKSRDKAGNESAWSNQTSTIIDSTTPVIRYFKSNKLLLSPVYGEKGEVTENAYIQGGADDATTELITLEVLNATQKIVYTESIEEKSYLWAHWPDKSGYPDGVYSARLVIKDAVGHIAQSETLILTLDTTSPPLPMITGIRDKQLFNHEKISFSASCKEHSFATVYLGGKIIASNKEYHTIIVNEKNGSHTLSVTCTDLAGNKSSKSITFIVDTVAPSSPSITYIFNSESKILSIKFYCREDSTGELFLHGVSLLVSTCKKNSYITYSPAEALTTPYYATYSARLSDIAGNTSPVSEKTIYIDGDKETVKQKICSATFEMNTSSYSNVACNWEQDDVTYTQTSNETSNLFRSIFTINTNHLAKIAVTIFNCKQKSLWDPRTWYSCVKDKVEEKYIDGKLTPLFSSRYEIRSVSNTEIDVYHPKLETIAINKKYLLQFSNNIGGKEFSEETISPQEQVVFTPSYKSTSSKFYFSWLFTSPKEVSQWHGITAFQKPHGGIDFSVSHAIVLAPAKGKVVSAGYNSTSACYAGGNYLGILHPNGLYSYYFHLNSIKYPQGKTIQKGDLVTVGQKLAETGNSGMYNCEPLGAHLHFEVRTNASTASHVNPVPYFNIDWNAIKTANAKGSPGRLTGDNPHPKF